MTVQELIDELSKYPADMEVRIVLPKRKAYEPEYDVSVHKFLSGNWSENNWAVMLRREKQLY